MTLRVARELLLVIALSLGLAWFSPDTALTATTSLFPDRGGLAGSTYDYDHRPTFTTLSSFTRACAYCAYVDRSHTSQPRVRISTKVLAAKGASKLVEGARYPLSPKIQGQLAKRGWTTEAIDEAVQSGKQVRAVNKATGNPATRYIHPNTGQSVVIDDVTGQVIHVGGPGFKYGPGSGDVP